MSTPDQSPYLPPVASAPSPLPPVADVVTDHEFDLVPDTDHCRKCGHGRFARQHTHSFFLSRSNVRTCSCGETQEGWFPSSGDDAMTVTHSPRAAGGAS